MKHISVLKNEVIEQFSYLADKDGFFVDGTLGFAGHSIEIARKLKNIKVVGIDRDEKALDYAKDLIAKEGLSEKFIFVKDNFSNIKNILEEARIENISGALLDLGVSSMQLDDKERGFSFEDLNADLDMRMDLSQKMDAKTILNSYNQTALEKILKEYGEERFASTIARNICRSRKDKPLRTVSDLILILEWSIPKKIRATSKKHFATNTFRALRIEVNNELKPIEPSLKDFIDILSPGAKLAVITFHSSEDRIVKNVFKELSKECSCPENAPVCICDRKAVVRLITKKPIVPSIEEINQNPRSRSAKLRVVEKA